MKYFFILLVTAMLYIPSTASAYISNGDFEYGYYTIIYGDKHPISTIDSHKICPALDLTRITRKREYSGPFTYEYIPFNELTYSFDFTLYLLDQRDNLSFDKSQYILAKFGNRNYTLKIAKIYKEKEKKYISIMANISRPCMNALLNELQKGNPPAISFSLPLNSGKYANVTLNLNEIKECIEGILEFSQTLR